MVFVHTLPKDDISSTWSSTGSIPTEVLHLEDDDYDLDFPSYPPNFPRFLVFLPRRGDLVLNVSNDEPAAYDETDNQRQQCEQHNANRAKRQAHEEEERQRLHPQNLNNVFHMVGNQQVFKTSSANVVVAIANLERLPDTLEYQDIRFNIRAHLIAAMGHTVELVKQAQVATYTSVTSSRSHRSRISEHPGSSHRNNSPPDDV